MKNAIVPHMIEHNFALKKSPFFTTIVAFFTGCRLLSVVMSAHDAIFLLDHVFFYGNKKDTRSDLHRSKVSVFVCSVQNRLPQGSDSFAMPYAPSSLRS
jgi:hypothetical protein